MKISRISIQNFRSIKSATIIADNFNIFVGQNNHGKTNFFEAVDFLFTGLKKGERIEDVRCGRIGEGEVFVEIEFSGAQDGAHRMQNEGNRTKMLAALGENDTVIVRRSSVDSKKRMVSINGVWLERLPTGFDNAFNDFLPRFEYVDTRKYFEDVAKYSKTTPIGIMLSAVLTTILETSPQYQQFREQFETVFNSETSDVRIELDRLSNQVKICLEKQFPDCVKVTFEVSPPIFDDLLKTFDTTIDDGIETSAAEKGDGMQRALMLAILQAYAAFRREHEDIGKSFLFFIDEAELHLHPMAQRKLKNVLIELSSSDDQVFINTHSSVLVVDDQEHQAIFKVVKTNKETSISAISVAEKPYVVFELLGGSPADLLLPRNFLIVEGKSDFEFLTRVVKRHYTDQPAIQIISADGDLSQVQRSLNAVNQAFKPLATSIYRDKTIIYVDQQANPVHRSTLFTTYPYLQTNTQFIESTASNIEEYYPTPWQKTNTEVQQMTGPAKLLLAEQAGNGISRADFEAQMAAAYQALQRCWDLAY